MKLKRVFSLLVAISLVVLTIIPMNMTVLAADVGNDAFASQISYLKQIFRHGEYWNSYNACGYEGTGTSVCPSCSGRGYCAGDCPDACGQFYYNGYWVSGQCLGWACKMGNWIFGGNPLAWSKNYDAYAIKPGDILYGNVTPIISGAYTHAIFITNVSGNTVTYADCNAIGPCKVRWDATTTLDKIATSVSYGAVIYHANNNKTTGNISSTPTPDPVYENITEDTYVVKNNYTGTYMCVSYGADTNLQNVDMYNEINAASRMVITKASTGYKIRPECCESRLVNPYGYTVTSGLNVNIYNDENDSTQWWQFQKVSGGYVIRNVQNPDCVLDTDGGNVFVSSYTGASTQIWSLISTHVHSYGSWKVKSSATCTSNGTEYRTCGCGAEETRTISALGHNYTSATTKPTCTSGGYTTYTCSRCSHSYTGNSTSAKGHTPGAAATCTSAQTCATCGVVLANAKGHTPGAAATCTSAQTCTTCGVVLASAKGHTPSAAATCTSAQTCTTCGVVLANAKGHTPGAAATSTSAQTCTTCGVVLANATNEYKDSQGISYTLSDDGTYYIVSSFDSSSQTINIRSSINNIPVTIIGEKAFESCTNLTSVNIPDSVTTIGDYAFAYCKGLTNVTLGNKVTSIDYAAFYQCRILNNISLPDSLLYIEDVAFAYCVSLTEIDIPASVTNIGSFAFTCCTNLKSITVDKNNEYYHSNGNCLIITATNTLIAGCENSIIPNYVVEIGGDAFAERVNLSSIVIPDSVIAIRYHAFAGCYSLTSIFIPSSVTVMGKEIFNYSYITDIYCEAESQPEGWDAAWLGDCGATVHWGWHTHTPGSAATCTSAQTCTTCGVVLANAKGHTPGAAATCMSPQTCTSCGVMLNPTTDHNFQYSVTDPTCTEEGYSFGSCEFCEECRYGVIDPLGHTEGEWETLPDGSKELHCTVCGELLDSEAAPSYKEGDITGDGKVNMFDYVKLKSCYLDKTSFTDEERIRADITGDGKVNIFDYTRLKVLVLIG